MKSFRKIITLITIIILFQGILLAQTSKNDSTKTKVEDSYRATNSIYLELGGNCAFYSLNYEKEIFININARIGFSALNFAESSISGLHNHTYVFTTFMVNYLTGEDTDQHYELGAGILYTGEVGLTSTIGYRYSPQNGGFVFKIALTPFVIDRTMRFWGGISLGYRF